MMFTLSNCQKVDETGLGGGEISEPNFSLIAVADPVSKTVNDDLKTVWANQDKINVFHAQAGSADYVSDNAFAIDDIASNKFFGTVTDYGTMSGNYDWYAFYPYSEYIKTPANSSGYTVIGSKTGTEQQQDGYGNKSHIAGENVPLYGKVSNVAIGTTPSIRMKNAASVINFHITNSTTEEITISKVSLSTTTIPIIGTYYIDFSNETLNYTSSGDKYVSNTVAVNVTNATPVAIGESIDLYAVIKPFSAPAGEKLTIIVNTDKGSKTSEVTLSKEYSANAGDIEVMNVNYDAEIVQPVDYSGLYLPVVLKDGEYVYLTSEASGSRLATANSGVTEITDYISASDFTSAYDDYAWELVKVEGTQTYTMMNLGTQRYIKKVATKSNYAYTDESVSNAENLNIELVSENTFNIVSTSSDYAGRILAVNEDAQNTYYAFFGGTQLKNIILLPYSPRFSMNCEDQSIESTEVTGGQIPVTTRNAEGWTITASSDQTWLRANYENSAIKYSCEANTGEIRSATITLTATKSGYENVTASLTVTQAAGNVTSASVDFTMETWKLASDGTEFTAGTETRIEGKTFVVKPVSLSLSSTNNTNGIKYYNTTSIRVYGSTSQGTSDLTFTTETGNITKIEFTFDGSNKGTWTCNNGTYSSGMWTGSSNNIVLTTTTQARISNIKVTYAQ